MNDSSRNPKDLPPDDFAKTTPSIRSPKQDSPKEDLSSDWEKTNYNYSPKNEPPAAADWGKTAVNINVPRNEPEDNFGKTYSSNQSPNQPDWGMTQANINVAADDFGQEDFGGARQAEHGATTPYFRLPERERAKYQNAAPSLASAAPAPKTETTQREEKRGIPSWLLVSGGLLAMFLFAVVVLFGVYYLFLNKTGFELTLKGAPAGSDVFVDNSRWGVTAPDGSIKLQGLKAGEIKTIDIKQAGYTCKPQQITGENGKPAEMIAQCSQNTAPQNNECQNIKAGDYAKARKCAYEALAKLKDPFTVEELLRALNLYIVNFPSGKFNINSEDMKFLQTAAGYIKRLPPNVVLEVGGHTDNRGNKASNQTLSDNRAKAVKDALVSFGISDSVLQTRGYGDAKPKSTNDTEDGRFQNRRIEYSAVVK